MSSDRARRRLAALTRAKARGLVARVRAILFSDDDVEGREDEERARAGELARAAAELKGGMAKLAQLMAYLPGEGSAATDEARASLGVLWDRAPAVSAEAVKRVVEEDLGASIETLFDRFEPEPFAAASLGQVHAATAKDGRPLAVKVQYPGVAEALADDVASPDLARRLAGAGVGRTLDDEAMATLRNAVLAELDYGAEGRAMERFADCFRNDPHVVIPSWWKELSSRRVLTMDRLQGASLAGLRDGVSDAARAAVGLTIFRFAWGAPLRFGLLNADPNPGNYLVLDADAGRVGFLDFGCSVALDESIVDVERRLWKTLLERDQHGFGGEPFRLALVDEGIVAKVRTLDSDTYREWERYVTYPFRQSDGFEWTPGYAKTMGETFGQLVQAGAFALPAPALLLWRQRLGVASVLGSFAPRADFRRAIAEILA